MPRRSRISISGLPLLLFAAILPAPSQTAAPHPITSLPRPPVTQFVAAPISSNPITTLPPPTSTPPMAANSAILSAPPNQPAAAPEDLKSAESKEPTATIAAASSSSITPTVSASPAEPNLSNVPLRTSTLPAVQALTYRPRNIRPFSALAIQFKGGFAGFGIDLATPLAQRVNLRIGGSAFQYSGSYNVDGITFDGEVKFRSGTLSLDWFPFNNGFRISPGVTLYNGNNLNAALSVPAGQNFDLGDDTYVAGPGGVSGSGSLSFGRRIAPSLTIGFGNMIPRSGRHFSVPFEIGFQYIGDPLINLNLAGTACDPSGCGDLAADPTSQADLKQELSEINSDIRPLRFYPIISLGLAYRFGHTTAP
jgi:hypothetical protein